MILIVSKILVKLKDFSVDFLLDGDSFGVANIVNGKLSFFLVHALSIYRVPSSELRVLTILGVFFLFIFYNALTLLQLKCKIWIFLHWQNLLNFF